VLVKVLLWLLVLVEVTLAVVYEVCVVVSVTLQPVVQILHVVSQQHAFLQVGQNISSQTPAWSALAAPQ
jgi:hypothetical protein